MLSSFSLEAVLRVVAEDGVVALHHFAGIGAQLAGEEAKEGRLAHAVGAYDADAFVALKFVGKRLQHYFIAKFFADIMEFEHFFAEAGVIVEHFGNRKEFSA